MTDQIKCVECQCYRERILELEKLLEENTITKEYSIVTTNEDSDNENNILDLSYSRIDDIINRYYNEELFYQGQKGIIYFIYSYIVRDDDDNTKFLYKCINKDKKIFQYLDYEGVVQKDIKCKKLIDSIYELLLKRVNKIYRITINKIYEEEEIEEDSDSDEYDSDIEEIIATELNFIDESMDQKKSADDKLNIVVNKFLEIKKCCGKVRKPIIDELSLLLS
jgi:hypothetical protein